MALDLLPVWFLVVQAGVLGLLVGSFLNVVVHRLPIMMQREWDAETGEAIWQRDAVAGPVPNSASTAVGRFNLLVPRSRCPHCGHQIRWFENIPVISWLVLRGKCSNCSAPISKRYPLVELVSGVLAAFCALRYGGSWTTLAWMLCCWLLLACALIDWDETVLPDVLTYPLLWLGLLTSALGWNPGVPLVSAVWGAAVGYVSLWIVHHVFKLLTGKVGMGHGDFKLFAALGAWFGLMALVPIVLMSSVVGAVVGIALKFTGGLREGGYVPFGPFLAGAAFAAFVFGPFAVLKLLGL